MWLTGYRLVGMVYILTGMVMQSDSSKTRLLNAALMEFRAAGYSATTVDDICRRAGVTKGSFFHHFKSKEQLALEAADFFSRGAESLFGGAPYARLEDPLERFKGYIDFRISILKGELPEFTCLLGTMVQEVYSTHPEIRSACERALAAHTSELEKDIRLAKDLYVPHDEWSPESLAAHTQAVIQGAFILAKARQSPEVASECLRHLRRYVDILFTTRK
jgi:TetR/AcrR family transcriptional regulator, transcriptional repressor for nem operon